MTDPKIWWIDDDDLEIDDPIDAVEGENVLDEPLICIAKSKYAQLTALADALHRLRQIPNPVAISLGPKDSESAGVTIYDEDYITVQIVSAIGDTMVDAVNAALEAYGNRTS